MTKTPASLLERLRAPLAPEAWARFVELYAPLIYSWGRRAGLREPDAADLMQDVFVTLLEVLPTFSYDRHRSFQRWLRTVTFNKWRDRRQRTARQPAGHALEGWEDRLLAEDSEPRWEAEDRQQLVGRALALMQRDFQSATWKAFWGQVVECRSATELAAELGLTVGAVYAARFRVLERLRREMAGLLD